MRTALTPPTPAMVAGLVGPGAFGRGAAYRDEGRVSEIRWSPGTHRLEGLVRGSGRHVYTASVWFTRSDHRLLPDESVCTCPVAVDCKHVAALLLEAHARVQAGLALDDGGPSAPVAPSGPGPAWRRTLDRLPSTAPATLPERDRVVRLALQLRVDGAGKANGASVSVRPVRQGVKGGWSGGYDVSWDVLAHPYYGTRWEPVAHGWLTELAALRKPSAPHYGSSTWDGLGGFIPRLLWPHLARGVELGVPLLGPGGGTVRLADGGEIALDLTADGDGLLLTPTMTLDGLPVTAPVRGAIGDGGLFAVDDDVLVIGPTPEPLSLAAIELLGAAPVAVPAADVADFWSAYHPRLARQVTLTSSDGTVDLPAPSLPALVVTATFEGPPLLRVACSWEYPTPAGPVEHPWQATTRDAAGRDLPAEQRLRDAVALAIRDLPALADTTLGEHLTFTDIDALDAAEVLLPALDEIEGVRVDVEREPAYNELTGAPQVTVAAVDTERTDWFDLAVTVRVADHDVPLRAIIEALGTGKKRLMLVDGSWLRLDHPALERLRELLDEASRLSDRPGRPYAPSINRYHAGLWEDLDELADVVDVSERWRASVGGLLALTSGGEEARPQPLPPPSGLKAQLRPYQQQGYEWLAFLHEHGLGGVLADDMGLGKTVQTLALIAHARESRGGAPFLVVAPASVVSNWAAEAAQFTPGLRVVTRTTTSTRAAAPLVEEVAGADVVVTSYAIFRLDSDAFHDLPWAGLILDEAQFVKNHASRANACARSLPAPFKLAITGTPMENDVGELWALLSVVAPGLYPSRRRFAEDYVKPLTAASRPGADPAVRRLAASRAGLLRRRVRPLMLRRTKDQVAPELPERQEQVLTVDLAPAHRRAYDARLQRERTRVLGMLDDVDGNRLAIFKSLTTLRRMALDASLVDPSASAGIPSSKLDVLVEQVAEVVAEGHRALVFSQFTGYLSLVAARLDALGLRFAYLDGSTRRRADVVRGFREGDAPLFLISLKAGGFGLNLTEADHVFLLDPWWNPATEAQAVDRTHRIGQTRPVNVVRMVAAGTIEEKVMALKERKAAAVGAVLGDGDDVFSRALDADDIRGLLTSAP
ncbi:Non-specific serine/threonine protein kinase [Xylanimonas cellulosilytica DSM 15894]|uniref:Non-specific serine/threonine protein kinase n=1 Tax=Xylanimonas cellulosilytica (strain DSM 15894 / JCM 12276 / CECT 5975 / KCTC 9989 / LMG 20990 / NBRC 107835 / XIL07) TaxID=446471 RepID=D1BUT3_XYLCX|nr:DEAD/DEAH box helicase [Xylanimonas cellulosilytica]ACZ29324.1 Non-specific serine/threonine protein kinase [Xylanimonas cellulosilytica DSM 15894]